jgi:hypothetical protein
MHTQLTTKSKYVTVTQHGGGLPYVYQQGNPELAGEVRYDTSQRCLKIFDGNTWHFIPPYNNADVSLSPEADKLLDWAKQKQQEELELEQQAKDNPTIADLLKQKADIEEKIKIVKILIKDNNGSEPA